MQGVETYSEFKNRDYHVPSVVDVYWDLNTSGAVRFTVRGGQNEYY